MYTYARHDLTYEECQMVLDFHMFINQKREDNIKGWTLFGVNKQFMYIPKENASSPTVGTDSVLLTIIVGADKNRDVLVIDIPNTFIQTHVKDKKYMAIINLRGFLVNILCNFFHNTSPM